MAGKLIGYARVSSNDQNTDLQLLALEEAGCVRIYEESASGAKRDRPELMKALHRLRKGDTLVVWKLDRLARSLRQLVETIELLEERAINFKCLTMDINTGSPSGKPIFHIFAGLAEFERNLIRERTKAGLDAARAKGKVGGRPPKIKPKQLDAIREQFRSGKYTAIEIADMHGIHRSSVYRLLDENGVGDIH